MMGYSRKKPEELLVVHPRARAATRQAPQSALPELEHLPAEVTALAARLREIVAPEQRAQWVAAIQGRFGNAFAERVVQSAQTTEAESEPEGRES